MSHLEEEVLVTNKEAHYSRNRLDPEVLLTCPFVCKEASGGWACVPEIHFHEPGL